VHDEERLPSIFSGPPTYSGSRSPPRPRNPRATPRPRQSFAYKLIGLKVTGSQSYNREGNTAGERNFAPGPECCRSRFQRGGPPAPRQYRGCLPTWLTSFSYSAGLARNSNWNSTDKNRPQQAGSGAFLRTLYGFTDEQLLTAIKQHVPLFKAHIPRIRHDGGQTSSRRCKR